MNGISGFFGPWGQSLNPEPPRGSRDRPWTQAEMNQLLPSYYRDQLMRYSGYDMPLDSSWAQTQPWFRPPVANQPPTPPPTQPPIQPPQLPDPGIVGDSIPPRQPAPEMGGGLLTPPPPPPIQPPGQTTSAVTPPPSLSNFPQLGADTGGLSNPLLTAPNVGWNVGKLNRRVTVPQRFQQTY